MIKNKLKKKEGYMEEQNLKYINIGKKFIVRFIRKFSLVDDIFSLYEEVEKANTSTTSKLEKINELMKESSTLILELEKDMKERTRVLKELQEKTEEYERLADIQLDKAKPLLGEIQKTLNKGKGSERAFNVFITLFGGTIFFFLGIYWNQLIDFVKKIIKT